MNFSKNSLNHFFQICFVLGVLICGLDYFRADYYVIGSETLAIGVVGTIIYYGYVGYFSPFFSFVTTVGCVIFFVFGSLEIAIPLLIEGRVAVALISIFSPFVLMTGIFGLQYRTLMKNYKFRGLEN